MSVFLGVLAALIPAITSLVVAFRALNRHRKSKSELKKRTDIEATYQRSMNNHFSMAIRYGDSYSPGFYENIRQDALKREGLAPPKDNVEMNAIAALSEQPLSKAQVEDQWALIISAVLSVILVAASWVASLLGG